MDPRSCRLRSSLEGRAGSCKTTFFICFFKTLSLSLLIVCFHRDGIQLFTAWTWHLHCCLSNLSYLAASQIYFYLGKKLFPKYVQDLSFLSAYSLQFNPLCKLAMLKCFLELPPHTPHPWLTLLTFTEVSSKLWIKCSDHLNHPDPGLRRNLDMMLRFAPLQIWGSEAPKTVSEWKRCNASVWPGRLHKRACLEKVKHSAAMSQNLPVSWA